jgi:preprotein translocase subunit YajC
MSLQALLLAQSGQQGAAPWYVQLLPLVVIGLIFYFFLIAPARKRQKAHDAMIKSLQPGERVITNGGLIGTIVKVEENTLKLRLAPGIEVSAMRTHVAGKAEEEASS